MKRPSVLFIYGTIAFTLIAVGYLVGYISLSGQAQKLTQLEAQIQVISNSQMELYDNLAKLNSVLKEFETANRREIEELLWKIDDAIDDIQEWRDEYTTFLDNIKKGINNLTSVDLGEVEVEREKRR